MKGPPDGDAERDVIGGVDRRQLLLVGLCLCGLVVAAFLAPPPVSPSLPADETRTAPPPDRNAGGGGGVGDGDGDVVGDGGDPVPVPGDDALADEDHCAVLLAERPIPGSTVTVRVFDEVEPVADARVWFNGEPVGRTDEHGNVSGPVPYNRTLSVTVDADRASDCEFYRTRYDEAPASVAAAGSGTRPEVLARHGASVPFGPSPVLGFDRRHADEPGRFQGRGENATGNYTVYGRVDLSVEGKPYPGSSVTVTARVAGVPMRGVAVTSDGEQVGETDDQGRYRLRVPERDAATLAVSRGDFTGDVTVDVLLLEAAVRPAEGLPFPGERARANVTLDDSPSRGVAVSLDGRRLGSTTSDGVVAFGLPVDPGATVTARTSRQVARVPLWRVYFPTAANALFIAVLGFATSAGAARFGSPAAARPVAAAWSAVGLSYAALVVGEGRGLLLALGVVATVGLYRRRQTVRDGGEATADLLTRVIRGFRRFALAITRVLERLLDRIRAWFRRAANRLEASLRSPRALLAAVLAGLDRVRTAITLSLTVYRAGFLLLATAEIVAATARWEARGFAASVAGFACLAAALVAWRHRDVDPGPGETSAASSASEATGISVDASSPAISLRGRYRRFARWVVPGDWRRRTPGEVSRTAIDRGFPRGPVEALTGAFRDVEYGDDPPESRREQARTAYERLAGERRRRERSDEKSDGQERDGGPGATAGEEPSGGNGEEVS